MKILMVLTSHSELGNTGKKTGFWIEEFVAPYYIFAVAGAAITVASPKGGQPPIDQIHPVIRPIIKPLRPFVLKPIRIYSIF